MLNFSIYWDDVWHEPADISSQIISDDAVKIAHLGADSDKTPFADYNKKEFIGVLQFDSSASELLQALIKHEEDINGDDEGQLSWLLPEMIVEAVKLGIRYGKKRSKPRE